jgi:hypothetical protein
MNSVARLWRLAPSDNASDKPSGRASTPTSRQEDDFPYRVEIWNSNGTFLQQTLAITISKNVGFASYYAALEQLSDGLIVLRHKDDVLARWNAPQAVTGNG